MRKIITGTLTGLAALAVIPMISAPRALTPAGCVVNPTPSTEESAPTDQNPWTAEQRANTALIVTVGTSKNIPPRGWVIAVATAIQESRLRNLPGGDRDSIGLFQQRPSQGWGTPTQLADPAYQAGKFYDKLLTITGWQNMPLTAAAQAVQQSAYPNAYAPWEDDAETLVTGIATIRPCNIVVSAQGWTQPVHAPIVSTFRSPQRPSHDGVDLGAARHTVILAAAAGTVSRVRCNATDTRTGADWGCHRDGDPERTRGCGWYVDITHPGDVITRYCHMNSPPLVMLGDTVTAGQPLGEVGSTGHSSGPHLHFEVHINADPTATGAIDPVPWMQRIGASLTSTDG